MAEVHRTAKNWRVKDVVGLRVGKLVVVRYAWTNTRRGDAHWECLCDCGNTITVSGAHLRTGHSKSCGCARGYYKHGHARRGKETTTWVIWHGMNQRCRDPKWIGFANYGGRGISVCESWRNSFEAFWADMGERPSAGHSLDRINNNGNYEPSNCRWATSKEQQRNRRNSNMLTIDGKTRCLAEWAESAFVSRSTIVNRIRNGMSPEKAVAFPPQKPRHAHSRKGT